jgi:amino acid transporter
MMTPQQQGAKFDLIWIGCFIAVSVVVLALGYYGLQVSAKAGTILGGMEIVIFLFLAAWMIAKRAERIRSPPSRRALRMSRDMKESAAFAAAVYAIMAFVGFEAAAPLAEEAENPRFTIPICNAFRRSLKAANACPNPATMTALSDEH